LSQNSHLQATSLCSDLPRELESKVGIYEVSHLIDLSGKIDALCKKFDRLLCMNKMNNSSHLQDVRSICASLMHASFECPSVGPSDAANEQVSATQGFSPTNNRYSNTYNYG